MKTSGRYILFVSVLIVLAAVVVYRFQNPFVQETTDQLTFTGKTGKTEKTGKAGKPVRHTAAAAAEKKKKKDSLLTQFISKPQVSGIMHRDLFAEYRLPVKKRVSVKPVLQKEKPPTPAPPKRDLLAEAREHITSYRLYGTYQDGDKKAVFLSKDKLVLVARTGDRLDGKYLIQDIQDTYITFKTLEENSHTLRLDMREFKDE